MNKAYLLLGGNIGDSINYLEKAVTFLNEYCGSILERSSVYQTEPWGKADQQSFLNQALVLLTPLNAQALMLEVLKIEQVMGRLRTEKYGPRIIDIDILFFNDEIIREHDLTIPHPELQNRRFVLTPLAELVPDKIHPVFHKTVAELLAACVDPLQVFLYERFFHNR